MGKNLDNKISVKFKKPTGEGKSRGKYSSRVAAIQASMINTEKFYCKLIGKPYYSSGQLLGKKPRRIRILDLTYIAR
ncbi:MAG: hypothetical protein AABW81_02610 [Nanoarchaeota archaeon]